MLSLCLLSLILAAATPVQPTATRKTPLTHCVTRITPSHPGQRDSVALYTHCFATFAEAIADATEGRTHLPSTMKPQDLTQTVLNTYSGAVRPNTTYVLSIEYDLNNFGGSSVTLTGTATCSNASYWISNVGTWWPGWNDRIRSAKGFSDCNNIAHYENVGWTGASLVCTPNCSSMGVMSAQTSSLGAYA